MSVTTALLVSLLLLVLNGFFVAAEFGVVAAKRHRLEERAAAGSRRARAAVEASRELSLMLAGAQLGITLCTLGLGALSEPAVARLLEPVLHWLQVPQAFTHVIAVLIAVALVVFLHMVVGEMAPKSWTISHPERSALALALPFRWFTWVVRPLLHLLNGAANLMLRALRVDPVDAMDSAHTPADLQLLLAQSHEHGVLPDEEHQMLTGALRLEQETIASVMFPPASAVTVPTDGTVAQVEQICRDSGRSRLFVRAPDGAVTGLVHVRDAMRASTSDGGAQPVRTVQQTPVSVPATLHLIDAVHAMRQHGAQLALVTDRGRVVGMTSLEDILEQILGEFDDESDEQTV